MAEHSGDNSVSSRSKYDSQNSHSQSLRQAVYELLDKNPLLTARPLCKLLNLPYRGYRDYVAHLQSKWRYDHKNRLGLKCLSFHGVHGLQRAHGWQVAMQLMHLHTRTTGLLLIMIPTNTEERKLNERENASGNSEKSGDHILAQARAILVLRWT